MKGTDWFYFPDLYIYREIFIFSLVKGEVSVYVWGNEMKILVIGDLILDRYFWGDISRISPEVPVPVCNLREVTYSIGGAANVAHNLINLGVETFLAGIIGNDEMGKRVTSILKEKGIFSELLVDKGRPTIVKTRVVGSSCQHIVRIDEEVVKDLSTSLKDRFKRKLRYLVPRFSGVILSDYAKGVLLDRGFCQWLVDLCNRSGVPVFVDPKGTNWYGYEGATCVTPNKKELYEIARAEGINDENLSYVARKIIKKYSFSYLLVTLGPEGMVLFTSEEEVKFPSNARDVYDVSGAGDTVIATLAAFVCNKFSIHESVFRANTAAGIVVTKVGTYPVSLRELEEELDLQSGRSDKFYILDEALHKIASWRSYEKSIVFTNGCFDILHAGHILLFREAKKLGDKLIVAINTDESVRQAKGFPRPVLKEKERLQILSAIEYIDVLLVFEDGELLNLISLIKPDILLKGNDYTLDTVVGKDIVHSYGGNIKLTPILEDISISHIIGRINGIKNVFREV